MVSNKYKKIEYQFALSNEETQHFKRTYNLLEQMVAIIEEDEPEEGTIVIDFAGYAREVQYDTINTVYSYLYELI